MRHAVSHDPAVCPSRTTSSSTKQAIEKVLTGRRKPMTVAEIAEAVVPVTNLDGKTPKQSLVKKAGDGGVLKLNPKRRKATAKS